MARTGNAHTEAGFSLIELLIVIGIMACLGAVATPVVATYYSSCAVKTAMTDICQLIREARGLTLASGENHAVTFNRVSGDAALVADRGDDGLWNTSDDHVVRSVKVVGRGGVQYGYGSCGPVPGLAKTDDGITFQVNNAMICNQDLSSNAGTVYLTAGQGIAMALTVNSSVTGYSLRRCIKGSWDRM